MTYGVYTPRDFAYVERRTRSRSPLPQAILCAAAIILSAASGLALLYDRAPTPAPHVQTTPPMQRPTKPPAPPRHAALLDPSFTALAPTAGYTPVTFALSVRLPARFEPASMAAQTVARLAPPAAPQVLVSALAAPDPDPAPDLRDAEPVLPLPIPRPLTFAPADLSLPPAAGRRRLAGLMPPAIPPTGAPDRGAFFDRLFGRRQPVGSALAYAAPEDDRPGLFGAARTSAPDRWTAVYDIAAHTVTLPDGTRLEAHSGLGARLDDPRGVTEHMRGATPPNVYELTAREGLFHGVAALRLNPVGGTTFGRTGLLAHTYMLGPRGDSNGCVVFRDYRAFRQAYDSGRVRRLVVVAGRG